MTPEKFQFKCSTQQGGDKQTDRTRVLEKLCKIFICSSLIVEATQDTFFYC